MRIQWETTVYTVSEDSGTVQLVLLKKGLSSYNLTVSVTTQDSSAKGTYECVSNECMCIINIITSIKNIFKNVEGCRDGSAKNHRN